jgi:outer membrane protein
MKNLPIIFSSLALVGVAILFGMNLKSNKKSRPEVITIKDSTGKEVIIAGARIAFVDIDTLESNYDYFKKRKVEFENRQKSIDAELEKMANTLQNEYAGLQKKAQDGLMSQAEGEAAQQRLMAKQQELELKRQNLGAKYLKDQDVFNKEIHDNLHKYIEQYNEEKGYDYILSYSKDGSILYANKGLDVTQDIIDGMNKSKGALKEKATTNVDTTKK